MSIAGWQISAADVSETLRPAAYALAVVASAWVLADARRRFGFKPYRVAAWTLLTLIFPSIVLPLYLAARLYTTRPAPHVDADAVESKQEGEAALSAAHPAGETGEAAVLQPPSCAPSDTYEAHPTEESTVVREVEESFAPIESSGAAKNPFKRMKLRQLALPMLYAAVLCTAGTLYFYLDYRSVEARLARAERWKLYARPGQVIREYRSALASEENPHTRKLLGLELATGGKWEEALAEFQAAEHGGEPDDKLFFNIGSALDELGRPSEAAARYRQFLQSAACRPPHPEPLCGQAATRLRASGELIR